MATINYIFIMRPSHVLNAIVLVALVAAAGCGKRQVMQPSSVVPAPCEALAAPFDVPDTISVAVFDLPDPGPDLSVNNDARRLVFHHLYESLITVDCQGEVRGALASSWQRGDRGRHWTFELREDARFWDGRPVTAWDVEWWWKTAMRGESIASAAIDSIIVAGDWTLDVYPKDRHANVPLFLSSSAFVVAALSNNSRWPNGSGPFRPGRRAGVLLARPAFGGDKPVIKFVIASARDARDLIDNEVDALITADPDVIDYARGRPQLKTVSLPWDKTYVLLSNSRVSELRGGESPPPLSSELLDALAVDAVRSDARGCEMPFWWRDVEDCSNLSVPFASISHGPLASHPSAMGRIVYDESDPVARGLAERIVALASGNTSGTSESAEIAAALPLPRGGSVRIVAEGMSSNELALSLRMGNDVAYILSLPRNAADPCFEARKLVRRAPWLVTAGEKMADVLVPLVDTRSHLIANGERVGAAVDWFGDVLLYGWSVQGDDIP